MYISGCPYILLDTNNRHVSTVWNIGASKFWWWPLAYCLTLNLSCPHFQFGNVQEHIIFLFSHIDFIVFLLAQVLICTITTLQSKVTNHILFLNIWHCLMMWPGTMQFEHDHLELHDSFRPQCSCKVHWWPLFFNYVVKLIGVPLLSNLFGYSSHREAHHVALYMSPID